MGSYVVRRLLLAVVVLFIVSVLTFMLIQFVPGDPVIEMLGQEASKEDIEALRKELWLDKPVIQQYRHWISNVFKGELGDSVIYQAPIEKLIAERVPITLNLSVFSLIISSIVGIAAGIVCAVRRGSFLDQIISLFANTGIAVPVFWLGILGIYFFGLYLGLLPIQGYTSPFDNLWLNIKQLIMPVFCLSVVNIAVMTRQTRSTMLEVIRQDYIRTARAKGIIERTIIMKHALKNAFIPIVTLLGFTVGHLLTGSVLVETVFNIPGMGRLLASSVQRHDLLVVQGGVLLVAVVTVITNLLVDISYGWLDPRVRY
jgi:peptide/nickel transport system permease protein